MLLSPMRTSLFRNSRKTLISILKLMISLLVKEATKVANRIQVEIPGAIITIIVIPTDLIAPSIGLGLLNRLGEEDKTNTKAIQEAQISGVETTIMALKAIILGVAITITISKILMEATITQPVGVGATISTNQLQANIIVQVVSIMEVLKLLNLETKDITDLQICHRAKLLSSRTLPGEVVLLIILGAVSLMV